MCIRDRLYGIWKGAPSSEAYLERIKNYKLKIKEEGGDILTDGEILSLIHIYLNLFPVFEHFFQIVIVRGKLSKLFGKVVSGIAYHSGFSGCAGRGMNTHNLVGYTRKDLSAWSECLSRVFTAYGAGSSDIFQVSYGYLLFTGGLGAHARCV